jgi:hypothetical protein
MTNDLVDAFCRPFIRRQRIVILFAQAEASLLSLVATLKGVDERHAQAVLKSNSTKLTWPAWSAMSGPGVRPEVGFRGRQVR